MVASVGPYALTIRRPGAACRRRAARRGSPASPPKKMIRSGANIAGSVSTHRWKSTVVSSIAVTPCRSMRARRAAGSSTSSLPMPTSRAPLSSAPQISKVAASNETFATWAIVSPAWNPVHSPGPASPVTPRWVISAPFGRPVDPEV